MFLDLNQHAPDIDDQAAFHLVMDAAPGTVEVDEIAARLHVVPFPGTTRPAGAPVSSAAPCGPCGRPRAC